MSFDPPSANHAFSQKFDFGFRLLCDVDKKMSIAYGAADPTSEYPRRAAAIVDENGKILHVFPKVSPKDFPNEALRLLG